MQVVPAFSPRIIIRTLFITVVFVVALYLIFLLRKPIGWVLIATFLAVALSGPVNVLNRHMRRGFAITIVYFVLLLIPIGIGALIIPPLVTQGNNLIEDLPEYAQDVQDFAERNERLRKIEADYNITEKLQEQAERLPARIGDAASVLGNIGFGVVNSLFALFTILVLTAFLLGSGPVWVNRFLELQPAGALGADAHGAGPHRQGGRRVRRRRARAGDGRGDPVLHRAHDPGRAVRGRAGDRDLLLRPRAARRRDDRRRPRRHRHRLRATSRRRRSSGSSTRSSTSSSRTR